MSSTKRKEAQRLASQRLRDEKKAAGLIPYRKYIKPEHVAPMDARLAELNKTGV